MQDIVRGIDAMNQLFRGLRLYAGGDENDCGEKRRGN
jgi:hypothetical protein